MREGRILLTRCLLGIGCQGLHQAVELQEAGNQVHLVLYHVFTFTWGHFWCRDSSQAEEMLFMCENHARFKTQSSTCMCAWTYHNHECTHNINDQGRLMFGNRPSKTHCAGKQSNVLMLSNSACSSLTYKQRNRLPKIAQAKACLPVSRIHAASVCKTFGSCMRLMPHPLSLPVHLHLHRERHTVTAK